jgi:hypothetical protein
MPTTESSPKEWIVTELPVTTISGVKVVSHEKSYRSQYYSIRWLADTFGDQIQSADQPRERLKQECEQRGYTELHGLFSRGDL